MQHRDDKPLSLSEEDDDGLCGVTLALAASRTRLGAAFYDARDRSLRFVSDTFDSAKWDLAALIIQQSDPSLVLANSSSDASFLNALETLVRESPRLSEYAEDNESAMRQSSEGVQIEYRMQRDFNATNGRRLMSLLNVAEITSNAANDAAPQLRAGAYLLDHTSNPLTLSCLDALLSHMQRAAIATGIPYPEQSLHVATCRLLDLGKVLQINNDAMLSLQVFAPQPHAATHSKQLKEGLSLWSLMRLTRSRIGHLLLRQWFLRPSRELDVIQDRHDAIECLLRPDNEAVRERLQSHLKPVVNVSRMLALLTQGRGKVGDWLALLRFIRASMLVAEQVASLLYRGHTRAFLQLLHHCPRDELAELGETVNDVIDWEESKFQKGRICVRRGYDDRLDKLRDNLAGLPAFLDSVASNIVEGVRDKSLLRKAQIVYWPQFGYLVSRLLDDDDDDLYIEGLEHQFNGDQAAYYKNDKCRELDTHIGDLHTMIKNIEIEILQRLETVISSKESMLQRLSESVAEVDCLLALAEAARRYDWVRPNMAEHPVSNIKRGRHPLVELCVDSFIPNDLGLIGGYGDGVRTGESILSVKEQGYLDHETSVLLLSGANFSGKSVYLKQCALIIYLAHLGSYVPAEEALIGLTDRILTRVDTKESVSRNASAFMIDLQQISFAMRNATASSLLLVDEFGKGTESSDGAGLFCAALEELMARGRDCPRVIASTHFTHVFASNFLSPEAPLSHAHMEIEADEDGGRVAYLYRLQLGLVTKSHAAACAQLFGIPPRVIARAHEATRLIALGELDALRDSADEYAHRYAQSSLTELGTSTSRAGASSDGASSDGADSMDDGEGAETEASGAKWDEGALALAENVCRRFAEWDLETEESASAETLVGQIKALFSGEDDEIGQA